MKKLLIGIMIALFTLAAFASADVLYTEDYEDGELSLQDFAGNISKEMTPGTIRLHDAGDVEENKFHLKISGTSWQEQAIAEVPSNGLVLEFKIKIDATHELQAIGFASGNESDRNELFYQLSGSDETLNGTYNWVTDLNGMIPVDGNWYTVRIPVGDDWFAAHQSPSAIDRVIYISENIYYDENKEETFHLDDLTFVQEVNPALAKGSSGFGASGSSGGSSGASSSGSSSGAGDTNTNGNDGNNEGDTKTQLIACTANSVDCYCTQDIAECVPNGEVPEFTTIGAILALLGVGGIVARKRL